MGVDQLKNPEFQTRFQRFAKKLYLESNFLLIYPLYSAVFLTLSDRHQVAFVFVLPFIKVLLKKVMATVAGDVDDLIPCMVTTAVIVLIDTIQNVYSLRRLSKQMREVQVLTGQSIGAKGLLAYVLEQIGKPDQLDPGELTKFRAQAFAKIQMPIDQEQMVQSIRLVRTKVKQPTRISRVLHDFVSQQLRTLAPFAQLK